jgi:hypothetical protein
MIAIVIGISNPITTDKGTFVVIELSTKQNAFVGTEHTFRIGQTVLVNTSKYKDKSGLWKSRVSLLAVTLG